MKLLRPHIPLKVRVEVARRQLERVDMLGAKAIVRRFKTDQKRLQVLLIHLFGDVEVQLDHNPALCNRKQYTTIRTGNRICYEPDANDPDYLIYRVKADHDIKTRVRGDGAQLSDLALRRKFKRIANKDRPVKKIPSRPFRS